MLFVSRPARLPSPPATRSSACVRTSHMSLTIEFIGTGDAFGSGGRFNTCFLVSSGSIRLLIDCGATSPVALQQRNLAPPALTHLLISHLHGDHFGGVPFLLLDARTTAARDAPSNCRAARRRATRRGHTGAALPGDEWPCTSACGTTVRRAASAPPDSTRRCLR